MATLLAPNQFCAVEDAENIKKACQGWGTDEKVIMSILGHRNAAQRKLLRLAYQETYHQDLIDQLKCELSGDLLKAICLWTLDPAERDAFLVHETLKKTKPNYVAIVEIACTRSAEELLAVKRAYRFRYKLSLEEDVASNTTGDIRKLLVAITSAYRYDGEEFDAGVAISEAKILQDEIREKAFKHEELIRILSTRSKTQLRVTFNNYKDIYGASITKGLRGGSTDDYLALLRTTIRCIKYPQRYFAKVLRSALNNAVADKDGLSRVVVTRAEKDLKEINGLYLKRNNISLHEVVAKDLSGDYKAFLLALLGNPTNYD